MTFIASFEIEKKPDLFAYSFWWNDDNFIEVVIYKNGDQYQKRDPITKKEALQKYGEHFPKLKSILI